MKFEELERKLARFTETSQWPHMAFISPSQKTLYDAVERTLTLMYGLAPQSQTLSSPKLPKLKHVLRIDCLLDSGDNIVQKQILPWIKASFTACAEGAPFRTVVFFHAERLSMDAQSALRRVIELYSAHTRFLITCTSSRNIIKPIQSRLACLYIEGQSDSAVGEGVGAMCEAFVCGAVRSLYSYAKGEFPNSERTDLGEAMELCVASLWKSQLSAACLSRWFEHMSLTEFASLAARSLCDVEDEPADADHSKPYPPEVYECFFAAKQAAMSNRVCDREAVRGWIALLLRASCAMRRKNDV
jgi:hypothetical protein